MPRFEVSLRRTETWVAEITVEAASIEAALEDIEERLDTEGWDSVCNAEGNYEECNSAVTDVRPCVAGDVDRLLVPP
jgi:hypothetical protein